MKIPDGPPARRHFQHVVRGRTSPAIRWIYKQTFLLALSAALALGLIIIARSASAQPSHESIEWCDIWISHANETNLPRVLLIGDSITRDYYPEVEKRLAGRAFVARLTTSRFLADPVLLKEIELVLDQIKFDVIHFNNGMHGWQYSEADYRKAFPAFLETIKAHAPKARLIWATTTPLRDETVAASNPSATCSNERIAARNTIATEMAAARNIPSDDLNASMRGHPEYHSDNVHFNTRGIQIQAAQVSAEAEKLLPPLTVNESVRR
jgi:lysophospholipase L1-like esterase